jgi:hypothetical protein
VIYCYFINCITARCMLVYVARKIYIYTYKLQRYELLLVSF